MKKLFVSFLCVLLVSCFFSSCSNEDETLKADDSSQTQPSTENLIGSGDEVIGEEISSDGLEFNELEDRATVISYNGNAKVVEIPSLYNGKPVTAISVQAFSGNTTIEEVICPDTLINVGEYAFWNCSSLKIVKLGNSVERIYDGAFAKCTSIETITIPKSTTDIGVSAFSSCTSLRDIKLNASITELSNYFLRGIAAEEIVIPEGVERLEYLCISECSNLKKLVLPESVSYIDEGAFYDNGDFTIVAPAGSYAETYADENGIPFQAA